MKVQIKAIAPTSYQTQSLRHFNIGCQPIGNGGYIGKQIFRTKKEAQEFLRQRAEKYYDCPKDIRGNLWANGLAIDAVTAYIEPLFENDESY